jgi:hypothetical protein
VVEKTATAVDRRRDVQRMVGAPMTAGEARASILRSIGTALSGAAVPMLPAVMDVFADERHRGPAALAARFRDEIRRVGGEARFVAGDDDLPAAIAAYVSERGFGPASLDYATADYALLRAEALFADTGSVVVIERAADRRVAPYLPRTSIVVGDVSALHAHMTMRAMQPIFDAARNRDPGEAVIITGPSRTADIEKTIVLGAHGPRDVIVFVVGVADAAARSA